MPERVIEEIATEECLRLISPGGIGRIAYAGRGGPAIRPVNYRLIDGAVVFRTAENGELDQDLRTGIDGAEYRVAFEIDALDTERQQGWSVLLRGPAHHLTEDERDQFIRDAVESWAGGRRDLFMRIVPASVTGRRVRPA